MKSVAQRASFRPMSPSLYKKLKAGQTRQFKVSLPSELLTTDPALSTLIRVNSGPGLFADKPQPPRPRSAQSCGRRQPSAVSGTPGPVRASFHTGERLFKICISNKPKRTGALQHDPPLFGIGSKLSLGHRRGFRGKKYSQTRQRTQSQQPTSSRFNKLASSVR